MSKLIKDLMTQEYKQQYSELDNACIVSVIGLDAISTNQLRGELRSKNLSLKVVKNSLARRAFAGGPMAQVGEALDGPCALVTGGESAIDAAKALVELRQTYPKIELKLALMAGYPELLDVETLAKMKNRVELLGELAAQLLSPGARLAGCLASPGGRIAGCLKKIAESEN